MTQEQDKDFLWRVRELEKEREDLKRNNIILRNKLGENGSDEVSVVSKDFQEVYLENSDSKTNNDYSQYDDIPSNIPPFEIHPPNANNRIMLNQQNSDSESYDDSPRSFESI